jgi:hypothetical protein
MSVADNQSCYVVVSVSEIEKILNAAKTKAIERGYRDPNDSSISLESYIRWDAQNQQFQIGSYDLVKSASR